MCASTGSSPGGILTVNPAPALRGPKHVVKRGKTPVLDGKEWRRLKVGAERLDPPVRQEIMACARDHLNGQLNPRVPEADRSVVGWTESEATAGQDIPPSEPPNSLTVLTNRSLRVRNWRQHAGASDPASKRAPNPPSASRYADPLLRCAIRSFLPSLKGRECANYFRHAGYGFDMIGIRSSL
jgi:hypothetical protein